MTKAKAGIKTECLRILKAFSYSWHGILFAWKDGGAFRTEILLTPFVIIFAAVFCNTKCDFFMVAGSWLLVFAAELFNTAIEAVTDLTAKSEISLLAKKAKDTASAGVLMACLIFLTACYCAAFLK